MPFSSPTAVHDPSTGGIAPASWGDALNAAVDFLANPPSASVRRAADKVLTTAVDTPIDFDTEDWDTDAIHDNAVNNTRLTCKTAGKYAVWAQIRWQANATGIRRLYVYKNGGATPVMGDDRAPGAGDPHFSVSRDLSLAVNDYLEFKAYQTSGGNLAIAAAVSGFGMRWVGQP